MSQEAVSWLEGDEPALALPAASGTQDLTSPAQSIAGEGRRVLLADDNADMRHYVERLLTLAGYRVDAVADGRAALETARQRRPDLILSRRDDAGARRLRPADAPCARIRTCATRR